MGPWLMQRLTPGHTTIPYYTILTQTGLGSADLASPPLAMGVTARRNVVLNHTMVMVIPLSMVICPMQVVDTLSNMCPWAREVPIPNLLSRTMAIPMLLPMLLFHLQLTEFTSSILVQDTPSNTFPELCLLTNEVTRINQNHIFKGNLLHL